MDSNRLRSFLAAAARPVLDGLDGLPSALREEAVPRGTVALRMPTSFAAQLAPPLFSEFRARHPLVRPPPHAHRAGDVGDPDRVLEVDSLTALYALVERGIGWSVLPYMALRREAADPRFTVRPLGTPPLLVRLLLATSTSRPVTPATHATMRFLHETVARLKQNRLMSPEASQR